MMYLMCLFKVLPHSDIPLDQDLDLPLSPATPLSPGTSSLTGSGRVGIQESKTSGVCVLGLYDAKMNCGGVMICMCC
ncbi:hypothetical protein DPMN_045899 [Dreissena polymorpha]|uniref:Uncharacterized protein n=1 Tax=Dreissena polymorpha TaxID=45954 RepID=A0A9D4D751_DREPO|nr:hypothetical protein DPMN_045899 [Dreissena polymorpha]